MECSLEIKKKFYKKTDQEYIATIEKIVIVSNILAMVYLSKGWIS